MLSKLLLLRVSWMEDTSSCMKNLRTILGGIFVESELPFDRERKDGVLFAMESLFSLSLLLLLLLFEESCFSLLMGAPVVDRYTSSSKSSTSDIFVGAALGLQLY